MDDAVEKARLVEIWLAGGRAAPYMVELNPTNNCNLRCRSCIARGKADFKPGAEMGDEKYVELVDDAVAMGVRRFHVMGDGEPMARRGLIMKLAEKVKTAGAFASMVTNGTLFKPADVEKLVEIGFDHILFSIDGPDAASNDWLRGKKGAFEKASAAAGMISRLRRRKGRAAPWLVLAPVLSSRNHDRMEDFVRLAAATGFDQIMVQPILLPREDAGAELRLDAEMQRKFMSASAAAARLADGLGIKHNIAEISAEVVGSSSEMGAVVEKAQEKHREKEGGGSPAARIACFQPWVYVSVRVDGSAKPCPMIPNDGEGEKVTEKRLPEIWRGRYFDGFRRSLASGRPIEYCRKCCGAVVLEMNRIREEIARLQTGRKGERRGQAT